MHACAVLEREIKFRKLLRQRCLYDNALLRTDNASLQDNASRSVRVARFGSFGAPNRARCMHFDYGTRLARRSVEMRTGKKLEASVCCAEALAPSRSTSRFVYRLGTTSIVNHRPHMHMFFLPDVYSALNDGRTTYKSKKLTATFNDRENYVIHFANLKYYLQQGMVLKKVRRVLAFRQTLFLKDYISWCTNKRQQAASKFSKDLFKLLANR